MKKLKILFFTILPIVTIAAPLVTEPIWVQQGTLEFVAAADVNQDGDAELIVVDRASGMVRLGHLSKAGLYWDEAATSGIAPVTAAACGRFLNANRYAIALSGTTANRIGMMDLYSSQRDVYSVFPYQLGPVQIAGFDCVPSQAGDELFCISNLPGSETTYIRLHLTLPSGAFTPIDFTTSTKIYNFSAAVQPEEGDIVIAASIQGPANTLQLYLDDVDGATLGDYFSDARITEDSMFVFGHYLSSEPVGQFLVYKPGSSNALILPLQMDGASGHYIFNDGIADTVVLPTSFVTLNPGPDVNEITAITADGDVVIVSFDGTLFTEVNTLTIPDGSTCTAAIALPGINSLYALFDSDSDGVSDSCAGYSKSGGKYIQDLDETSLSALTLTGQSPNVLFFDGEPLVDTNISRVAAYRTGSWTVPNTNAPTPPLEDVISLSDTGYSTGLRTESVESVSNLPASATHQLVNQLTDDSSAVALFTAVGESFSEVVFSPAGGSFDQAVQLTLKAPAVMSNIRVKVGTADWTPYSSPVWIYQDAEVSALAYNSLTGRTTPIKTVAFTFTKSPDEMDSDSDGVPDFVEIENGLNPDDGSDSDGDGISDLDELINGTDPNDEDSDNDGWTDRQERIAGTDPNNISEFPASDEDLYNAMLTAEEKQALFDLRVSPAPIDGTALTPTRCTTGITCRAYSFSGALLGVDTTRNNGFAGVDDASVEFTGLSTPIRSGLFVISTPSHFTISTASPDNFIGREMLALSAPPVLSKVEPAYTWGGGSLSSESSTWITEAQSSYTGSERAVESREIKYTDTLAALLFESLAARELHLRGDITNTTVSLFPYRNESDNIPHPTDEQIASLASLGPNSEAAYNPADSHSWLLSMVSTGMTASVAMFRSISQDIYEICSAEANDAPGAYALPVDAIRQLINEDTLTGGYTNHLDEADIALAAAGADYLLGNIPARSEVSLIFPAHNSGGEDHTILYHPDSGLHYNLVNSKNNPFSMDFAFTLPSNATVLVYGFLNSDAGDSGADREIEVIQMTVTALPAVTPEDQDPNLLPDSYEMLTFGSSGAPSTRDNDLDGFSDLQEYLEGTDPTSALSTPDGDPEDLGIPTVLIESVSGNVEVSLNWPARYQNAFRFQLESTTDLGTPFAEHPSASMNGDGDHVSANLTQSTEGTRRFYRVKVSLR